jgi:hypothetical protein
VRAIIEGTPDRERGDAHDEAQVGGRSVVSGARRVVSGARSAASGALSVVSGALSAASGALSAASGARLVLDAVAFELGAQ